MIGIIISENDDNCGPPLTTGCRHTIRSDISMSSKGPCMPLTVNQLDFTAVRFRGLPNFLYFAHFNFSFLYLRIFPDKNVASQKCL